MNASLTTLNQATYLGGSGGEEADALVIHPTSNEVYAAGFTSSTNFPGTAGGAQATNSGGFDAFAARLNPALTTLNQASYLGGSGTEHIVGLAIHSSTGEVYVAGSTSSTDFPGTAGGVQQASGGGFADVFVARLTPALTTLNQATYLGGNGNEPGFRPSLVIRPSIGEVYVAGATSSTDFPGTAGGAQATNGGNSDAFVARLSADLVVAPPTSTPTPTATSTPTWTPALPAPLVNVPMLSPEMLALLCLGLAATALLLVRKSF